MASAPGVALRGVLLLALLLLAAAGGPAVAAAAVHVEVELPARLRVSSFAAGEVNHVVVSGDAGVLVVTDLRGPPPVAKSGCVPAPPDAVRCSSAGVWRVIGNVGPEDDTFRIADSAYALAGITESQVGGQEGSDTLVLGSGADEAYGDAGDDLVVTGGGADMLSGGLGTDRLEAGAGNDRLNGDDGDDVGLGGPGRDVFVGDAGDDAYFGEDGGDEVEGGRGNDTLDGGPGDDGVRGEAGDDLVRGGEGDDRLEVPTAGASEGGADTVVGGPGDDVLSGGVEEGEAAGPDRFDGGAGQDTMDYSPRMASVSVSLDGRADDGAPGEGDEVDAGFERVVGGGESDLVTGSPRADQLDGGPGDDLISGLEGDDLLEGGAGDGGSDTVLGGDGRDTVRGGPGEDSLEGGPDGDALFGGGGGDALAGQAGDDDLRGGPGIDAVTGGDGDDVLNGAEPLLIGADGADDLDGGAGKDALLGGPGNDRLDGGLGPDAMRGEAGRDAVSYETRTRPVTVTFDDIANDGEPGEGDDVASDVELVLGGAQGDSLTGNADANALEGGPGDDLLDGGPGRDSLDGGAAVDVLRARDRVRDSVLCGADVDLAVVDRVDTVRDCEHVDRGGRRRPRLAEQAVVRPVAGGLGFQLAGARRSVPLTDALRLPIGSTVDARAGEVSVTTTRRGRATQTGVFSEGRFTIRQEPAREPVTELRLAGGSFRSCRTAAAAGAGPTATGAKAKRVRRLWGRVGRRKGKYRTRGRHSSGVVRGTTWLTEDRCDGTLTRVVEGSVRVRDLTRRRTVVVRAGESYLAPSPAAQRLRRSRPREGR